MPAVTPLLTVQLQIGGCGSADELGRVGGALMCIRGVEKVEPCPSGVSVSYRAGKVVPVQFERAVRAMGARLERIEPSDAPRFDSP